MSMGSGGRRFLANAGLAVLAVAAIGASAVALRRPAPPSSSSLVVALPSPQPSATRAPSAATPTPSTAAAPAPTPRAAPAFLLARIDLGKASGRTYEPDSALFRYAGPKVGLVDKATNSWGPVDPADGTKAYVVRFAFTGNYLDVVLHRGGTLLTSVDGTSTDPPVMSAASGAVTTVFRLTPPAAHGSKPFVVELSITGCLFGGVNVTGGSLQPVA